MIPVNDWFTWALLTAFFAALTAIFAKIGLEGIDSDYATLIRTLAIVSMLALFVAVILPLGRHRRGLTLTAM